VEEYRYRSIGVDCAAADDGVDEGEAVNAVDHQSTSTPADDEPFAAAAAADDDHDDDVNDDDASSEHVMVDETTSQDAQRRHQDVSQTSHDQ